MPAQKGFGLEAAQLNYIKNELTHSIKNKSKSAVFVFGSRSRGDHSKYSDLDIWIESTPPISLSELEQLKEIFSESDLPIKIDITTPELCLPEYKKNILSEKKFWF